MLYSKIQTELTGALNCGWETKMSMSTSDIVLLLLGYCFTIK